MVRKASARARSKEFLAEVKEKLERRLKNKLFYELDFKYNQVNELLKDEYITVKQIVELFKRAGGGKLERILEDDFIEAVLKERRKKRREWHVELSKVVSARLRGFITDYVVGNEMSVLFNVERAEFLHTTVGGISLVTRNDFTINKDGFIFNVEMKSIKSVANFDGRIRDFTFLQLLFEHYLFVKKLMGYDEAEMRRVAHDVEFLGALNVRTVLMLVSSSFDVVFIDATDELNERLWVVAEFLRRLEEKIKEMRSAS